MTLPSTKAHNTVLMSIMYIEDDLDIQSIARLALESIGGFDVTLCSSGAEALTTINSGRCAHRVGSGRAAALPRRADHG